MSCVSILFAGCSVLTSLPGSKAPSGVTLGNNYSRPEGQNVGNFLTDRNTSRVLAPPGGSSQISFGGDDERPMPVKTKVAIDFELS